MLDNSYALLFVRGECPVKDMKFDILRHPNVRYTEDVDSTAYFHGTCDDAGLTIVFVQSDESADMSGEYDAGGYVLLSEEDVEKEFREGTQNGGVND